MGKSSKQRLRARSVALARGLTGAIGVLSAVGGGLSHPGSLHAEPTTAPLGPEWERDCAGIDAGSLPQGAQIVGLPGGGGPVLFICGVLTGAGVGSGGPDFQDMYLVNVVDPANFYIATAEATGYEGFADFDTQVYVFRFSPNPAEAGIGLLGNEDFSAEIPQSAATSAANDDTNAQLTEPGLYYIAVSGRGSSPRVTFASRPVAIFDFRADPTQRSGPDGPAGGFPIDAWSGDGAVGSYRLELNGVEFIDTSRLAELAGVLPWRSVAGRSVPGTLEKN